MVGVPGLASRLSDLEVSAHKDSESVHGSSKRFAVTRSLSAEWATLLSTPTTWPTITISSATEPGTVPPGVPSTAVMLCTEAMSPVRMGGIVLSVLGLRSLFDKRTAKQGLLVSIMMFVLMHG